MSYITTPTNAPIDSHTYLYWPLNDAPGTSSGIAQLGSAGTNSTLVAAGNFGGSVTVANYNPAGTTPVVRFGRMSPTGNGVDIVQHAQSSPIYLQSQSSTFVPGSTNAISMHGWMNLHFQPGSGFFPRIISKWSDTSGGGSSPDAFAILLNANSTNLYVQASSNGTGSGINTSYQPGNVTNNSRDSITLHTWHHIGVTFNSGTVTFYLDGFNIAQGVMSNSLTNIAWGSGYWSLGGTTVSGSGLDAELSDWRVDTIVRPASYFQAIYERAVKR